MSAPPSSDRPATPPATRSATRSGGAAGDRDVDALLASAVEALGGAPRTGQQEMARAVSASTGAGFSPSPPAAPSQPRSTPCASAQKGCACVRRAYSAVMPGATQRSVVVQP